MDTSYPIRKIKKSDAKEIYKLIKKSKTLDLNSQYLYLLLSTHFKNSCAIAKHKNKIVALVLGYYLPDNPKTLFIWQVATNKKYRGKNLAFKLINNIYKRKKIDRLIATVSPSNFASNRVFEKFAKSVNSKIKKRMYFKEELFIGTHEDEILYKIDIKKEKKWEYLRN